MSPNGSLKQNLPFFRIRGPVTPLGRPAYGMVGPWVGRTKFGSSTFWAMVQKWDITLPTLPLPITVPHSGYGAKLGHKPHFRVLDFTRI